MTQQLTNAIHLIIVLAGIISYTVLTMTGHDGNLVLTATVGYGSGVAVQKSSADKL